MFKEKVEDINIILDEEWIFLVSESNQINTIVIHNKKDTYDNKVYADFKSLNYTCFHDPVSTHFSDEVFDQAAQKKGYSSTDGFSRYYQVIIT